MVEVLLSPCRLSSTFPREPTMAKKKTNFYPSEHALEDKKAGMIGNDYSKMANLPTEVMMKAYPMSPVYMDFEMEDNIDGIDAQLRGDNSARSRGMKPHKY